MRVYRCICDTISEVQLPVAVAAPREHFADASIVRHSRLCITHVYQQKQRQKWKDGLGREKKSVDEDAHAVGWNEQNEGEWGSCS